jgi:citrate lyase subunit beta/citryl-CoA lyase
MNARPSAAIRPRRSVLYVPGSNARAIDKARQLPCDAVILDLEDAVAPDMKDTARAAVLAAVRAAGFGAREVIVRVNALDTAWGVPDLRAMGDCPADAVLVPKIRSADDILHYDAALAHAPAALRLWAMVETAACVFRLDGIAATAASTRLACLVMGTNDLAKELRMQLDPLRAPLAAVLGLAVVAARSHELALLDGVFNAFADTEGFEAQCRQGLAYGFDGKTLIHPRQVEPCNAVFSPSEASIAWARRVRSAFDLPENAARGALTVDGAMVERLHLAEADRLLALDAAIRTQGNSQAAPTST